MNDQNKRGRRLFANEMHKEIFTLVFFAAVVPVFITAVMLFYLIFQIVAEELGIPEAIAYTLIPAAQRVLTILFVATPLSIFTILIVAYK